jgi:leucyl-tRNA synthetase
MRCYFWGQYIEGNTKKILPTVAWYLIYARFWHKFLFDIGTVSTEEPFPRLEFLGYILAENGKKFSKRDGNGIDPVDVINQFGADAFRLYEMFIGPFEQTALWNSNGMVGTLRFVERVWRINEKAGDSASDLEVQKILNKTIKKVGEHIEGFKFNTAVSAFMILANAMESAVNVSKNDFKKFIQILAPFAPHVTEELWVALGEEGSIHTSTWPSIDATLLTDDTIVLGVQVNGKVRAEIELVHDATEDQVREMVMQLPEVIKWMDGKEVKKFIFIPKKIISIVV